MSGVFTLSRDNKWSHLPTELVCRILSFLLEPAEERRPRPIRTSLDYVKNITTALPRELLHVAQCSTELRDRVIDVLGSRTEYITAEVAEDLLPEWLSVLGPLVKSVSAWRSDVQCLSYISHSAPTDARLAALCEHALTLFQALSRHTISLQVLDLKDVLPYEYHSIPQHAVDHLVAALKQSSPSLKELAVPVTKLYSNALEKVTLKNLDIIELHSRMLDSRQGDVEVQRGSYAEALMRILRSLEGHFDRSKKRSTLRELRLIGFHHAPCVNTAQSACTRGLFNAVTSLRVQLTYFGNHDSDSDARFICLFPNLECLFWNGDMNKERLQAINTACPKLRKLYLSPADLVDIDVHAFEDMLRECHGKVKMLELKGYLSLEQMKMVGEVCPDLQHIKLDISRKTVAGLVVLVGLCRRLRKIEFAVLPEVQDKLGAEHWRMLAYSVRSASDELCEVEIDATDTYGNEEHERELIIQSTIDVIEFLGERARMVCLNIFVDSLELAAVIDVCGRIFKACQAHTKRLEYLGASFFYAELFDFDSAEEEKESLLRLMSMRRDLVEALPHLHTVNFLPFEKKTCLRRLRELGAHTSP